MRHTLASTAHTSMAPCPVGTPPWKSSPPPTQKLRPSAVSASAALTRGLQGAVKGPLQGPAALAATEKALEEVTRLEAVLLREVQMSSTGKSVEKKHPEPGKAVALPLTKTRRPKLPAAALPGASMDHPRPHVPSESPHKSKVPPQMYSVEESQATWEGVRGVKGRQRYAPLQACELQVPSKQGGRTQSLMPIKGPRS